MRRYSLNIYNTKFTVEELKEGLHILTPRQELVLRKRLAWGYDRVYTLEEIGRELGVSRERIRQIEYRAVNKLIEHLYLERERGSEVVR